MKDKDLKICFSTPAPTSMDPGSYFTLRVGVEGRDAGKMEGKYLTLKDENEELLHRFRLMFLLGGHCDGDLVAFRAPVKAGMYTWKISLEGTDIDECFSFTVKEEHKLFLSCWDLPSKADADTEVCLRAGVKCSAGCDLGGEKIRILDENGTLIYEADLENIPFSGTKALYSAKLSFRAPKDPGCYRYLLEYPGNGSHNTVRKNFKVNVLK